MPKKTVEIVEPTLPEIPPRQKIRSLIKKYKSGTLSYERRLLHSVLVGELETLFLKYFHDGLERTLLCWEGQPPPTSYNLNRFPLVYEPEIDTALSKRGSPGLSKNEIHEIKGKSTKSAVETLHKEGIHFVRRPDDGVIEFRITGDDEEEGQKCSQPNCLFASGEDPYVGDIMFFTTNPSQTPRHKDFHIECSYDF